MGRGSEESGVVKEWHVVILPSAEKQLLAIKDLRIRESIRNRIYSLCHEPDNQGKPLDGDLEGYRSLRAVGQRYRIIYKVEASIVTVSVVSVGIRKDGDKKDVYAQTKKLARLGLLDGE